MDRRCIYYRKMLIDMLVLGTMGSTERRSWYFIDRVLKMPGVQPLEISESVATALITDKPKNFAECVEWARLHWQDHFLNQIRQLLFQFSTRSNDTRRTKRCPTPLTFDINDSMDLDYVYAVANLKAEIYGIPQVRDRSVVAELVPQINVPEFKPKSGVTIACSDAGMQADQNGERIDQDRVQIIINELINLGPLNI